MKYFISIILIAFFIGLADSECSSDEWKVVSNLDPIRILGRWYMYKTYANGHTDCIWYDLNTHPTKEDTVLSSINILIKNGTRNSKITTTAEISLLDPLKPEEKVNVAMENGAVVVKYTAAMVYDEFSISRSCIDGVEFIAIYVRNLYPSDATVEKMNIFLEEHGINQCELVTA